MPRREDTYPRLTLRVSFETTRLSAQSLIETYERLAPDKRRTLRPASTISPAEEARVMLGREGEHA